MLTLQFHSSVDFKVSRVVGVRQIRKTMMKRASIVATLIRFEWHGRRCEREEGVHWCVLNSSDEKHSCLSVYVRTCDRKNT